MNEDLKKELGKIAGAVRQLSMEAVQKANSGHPGMPMGCAELGAYMYGVLLKHNPKNPKWVNRDRVVLSAGHGSMWLYSCLHMSGFKVSIDDIKKFRQLHSITPGHPEYGVTEGVEATTGPLGQGVGNAVGMALGLKLLGTKFNRENYPLFNSKVFCVAGDGCMMEGISSEASSFAGHLKIDNLVLIYDSNHICLDGPLAECMSEDTKARYKAYGWDVFECDGYDLEKMDAIFTDIRKKQERPVLIVLHTVIGKGSPHKAGTHKAHGSPLGADEVKETKKLLGLPDEEFYVPQSVYSYFEQRLAKDVALESEWNEMFRKWSMDFPDLAAEYEKMQSHHLPEDLEKTLLQMEVKNPIASRASSGACIQTLAKLLPQLYGGSADLSGSDETMMKDFPIVTPGDFSGRNMKYGVREFAMAAMTAGLSLTGMIQPYCGTFFTFSDYMRNAIRLASLSPYHVIYQFTHDSIFLGEDGPTHQSIEQLASLRAMPNLHVIRPADTHEVKMAWIAALRYKGPTAIVLSRQNLPDIEATKLPFDKGMGLGGYIVKKEVGRANFTLFSTGSELSLALEVADRLEKLGKSVRVVSMPCWAIFEKQSEEYKKSVAGGDLGVRVAIEAAVEFGWHKYIGRDGVAICMEGFGHSAPAADLAQEFGFTTDAIVERLLLTQSSNG
ncbi:MAG: transketolase [Chlamydiae bacterium CG10_big_fil_rev_8_21_14_0_10_42_34]|nr:MAG: transketolase [Chlamydiae bacterium CG10_big_fil_rev_8_21_14_0_10_42_34]